MDTFITVEDARDRILSRLRTVGAERVTLTDAAGRYIAESIVAPWDSPAFDNSAMDGFAFRWSDRDEILTVIGESAAGHPFDGSVGPGEAVRIMTGAAVPDGADSVAMREICQEKDGKLSVTEEPSRGEGANIRLQGEYMAAGEPVLRKRDRLGGAEIGLLAMFGRTVVYVSRRPRVAIVTTGSELVEPDREPGPGQIINSNAYMIESLVRDAGGEPTVLPIVPDDEDATREAIGSLDATVDLVLTIGGVSVGDYDFVRDVLDETTGGMAFWKVRMKPGKPLAFGQLSKNETPVIGLPGNPVSSFVGFHQFVRPALQVLQGAAADETPLRRVRAKTSTPIRSTPRRRQYVLGALEQGGGESHFVPHASQSSGNVLTTCRTSAFGIVEEGVDRIEAGAALDVQIL